MLRRITLAIGTLITVPAFAQLTYKDCEPVAAADFKMTELFNRAGDASALKDATLSEPTRMDVRTVLKSDGSFDHADIIFVERLGNVKFYDGAAKTIKVMGKINTLGKSDNGLMGVAFHPDYAKNRWIYLWYSPSQLLGQNRQLRLTRMVVKTDNTLDMASEKILINILASKTDTWHSGGPMTFDAYGDLWVARRKQQRGSERRSEQLRPLQTEPAFHHGQHQERGMGSLQYRQPARRLLPHPPR